MTAPQPPRLGQMIVVFGRIGCLSFGGPAAQIALMHRELVERHRWMREDDYLSALSFCMLLPGPEAMQLATYAGWRLRGVAGGLLGGLLFVLPGALVISALVGLYLSFGTVPLVSAAFLGIKAAVVVIVAQALMRLSAKSMRHPAERWIAIAAFAAIFVLGLPFPLILFSAAIAGMVFMRCSATTAAIVAEAPQGQSGATHQGQGKAAPQGQGEAAHQGRRAGQMRAATRTSLRAVALWGTLWAAPLIILWAADQPFLLDLGLFFSKLAVVTFGGAYAVLAYLTQAVVHDMGWISLTEMIDALGLAETTPGPLILVTQFVAMLAGHHVGGSELAVAAGLVALWCTFVPCFLWIFAGAPWIASLTAMPGPAAALRGITAAVVGVIANLSVWFALHVWFGDLIQGRFAPLSLPVPQWSGFDPLALGLTGLAAALLLWQRLPLLTCLALMALAGIAGHWLTG